jgi:hypothetical protein
VNFKDRIDGFIFLLLEHKSWPARFTAFQALKYIFKPDIKNKLPGIIELFKKIKNKNTALDYLAALINYLVSTAGNLENEEIEVTVSKVFSEGDRIKGI